MNDLSSVRVENHAIAQSLREVAEILQAQRANPFRVGAYRKAADSVEAYAGSVRELFVTQGAAGLDALPGVGPGIAAAIAEMLRTGRWSQLDRLRGSLDPASLFQTVAGIGPELAHRIHDALGVDTLEALEQTAYDGRLESVEGVGPRRVTAIRGGACRNARPTHASRAPAATPALELPTVDVLLDVDREYRQRAARNELPTITPRRFNPDAKPWLPVLHTARDKWHFTALFSNTAKAHELGRTRDWVVLYFDDNHHEERQCTVVTEQRGVLAGKRVVRGREGECRRHYGLPLRYAGGELTHGRSNRSGLG